MEVESHVCDDEILLLESNDSMVRARRVWPYFGAVALVAAAGMGGRVIMSSQVTDVVSLSGYRWFSAWHSRPLRFDENGCTWDGDDCRSSRCCAKEGSECYVKNRHWASCNETCSPNMKWEAGVDRHGHWAVTHYPVWECLDITVQPHERTVHRVKPSTIAPTTSAPHVEVVPAPAPKSHRAPYSIYEKRPDSKTIDYGDRELPKRAHVASTPAPIKWENDDLTWEEEQEEFDRANGLGS